MIFLDYETYSKVDLKKCGAHVYAKDPSTVILLACWHDTSTGATNLYDSRKDNTDALKDALLKADEIHAWNAPFEMLITKHVLGVKVPIEKWRCTMSHALYRSLPGSLDMCSTALGFDGKPEGYTRLLNLFCKPNSRKEKPDDWQKFIDYNIQDVRLEKQIHDWLIANRLGWPPHEIEIWQITEYFNSRGVPIDKDRCMAALTAYDVLVDSAKKEMKETTGLDNPGSPTQLIQWLNDNNVPCDSVAKGEVEKILKEEFLSDSAKRVLELRLSSSMTAPKKYQAALDQGADGRMYGQVQYSGAGRTHRWAGRGFQVQNVRRGLSSSEKIEKAWADIQSGADLRAYYSDPFSLVADLVRSVIKIDSGLLTVADWSSIEVVMLYWAAQMTDAMESFKNGGDPYKDFAVKYFNVSLTDVTKEQRTFSKPVILGCGYGMGVDALIRYAENMGVKMESFDAEKAVKAYRMSHRPVVNLWYDLERAFKRALSEQEGKLIACGRFQFSKRCGHVLMKLPSGSQITYLNARVDIGPTGKENIYYDGVNQYTRKWESTGTWGGKLVENAIQSMSRDIMAHALKLCKEQDLPVCLHVHDEIVCEPVNGGHVIDRLQACMKAPSWCEDLPLRSEAFSCSSYRKG